MTARNQDTRTEPTRREFLRAAGVGVSSIIGSPSPWLDASRHGWTPGSGIATDHYLFSPGLVYLGTATLGPCPRKVVEATTRAWYELETNPTAMGYQDGLTLARAEHTRKRAADLLGCSPDEVAITRSTTDGMNAVAQGLRLPAGSRVLTSDQEHDGGSMCWRYLAHRAGIVVDVVPIPAGENDVTAILNRFATAIRPNTRVISVSHVLASTGLRMPISEISALARSRGMYCVVDGAQAVGGIAVNVKSLGCHAYATSGHKWLMGPKGTGLLYLASETNDEIQPIQFEDSRRYYNESTGVGNLPGAVGLGVAIDSLTAAGIQNVEAHNVALRNQIYTGLRELRIGRVVSPVPGPQATPLVTFEVPDSVDAQTLMKTLRDKHHVEVKRVPTRWLNGIRLSPHVFNTPNDVVTLLKALRTELT